MDIARTATRGNAPLLAIRDAYQNETKQYVQWLAGRDFVTTAAEYAEWLKEPHNGKRLSAATVNKRIAAVRHRIRWLVEHGKHELQADQADQIVAYARSIKGLKEAAPDVNRLTWDQVLALIAGCRNERLRVLMVFLSRTGCRISEALGALWSDLEDAGKAYRLTVLGKGSKVRRVPVSREMVAMIRKTFPPGELLFNHGGKPYNRVSITNRIREEGKRTLGIRVHAHVLRHAFAQHLRDKGIPIEQVSGAMGHSSVTITARYYLTNQAPDEAVLAAVEEGAA